MENMFQLLLELDASQKYLIIVAAFTLFRVFMYHFQEEYVTRIKIVPEHFKKKSVQELAYRWIGTIS